MDRWDLGRRKVQREGERDEEGSLFEPLPLATAATDKERQGATAATAAELARGSYALGGQGSRPRVASEETTREKGGLLCTLHEFVFLYATWVKNVSENWKFRKTAIVCWATKMFHSTIKLYMFYLL
jgi:hypothetical protein